MVTDGNYRITENNNMNDKTIELMNRLADKFGTTVEHLWGVLIKQAAITASTEILMALILVAAWVWMFRFVRAKTTEPEPTESNRYTHADWEDEGQLFAWIVVAVAALVVSLQVYSAISIGATALLNPEYWALKQVMP